VKPTRKGKQRVGTLENHINKQAGRGQNKHKNQAKCAGGGPGWFKCEKRCRKWKIHWDGLNLEFFWGGVVKLGNKGQSRIILGGG